jgi:hypothetical protein
MAPELVLALVEDDGQAPPITTFSDVYAFASVCLEVSRPNTFFCSEGDAQPLCRLRPTSCHTPIEATIMQ